MIMNMNEKGRQTKLLAAIAVLAMVVCAFAVVMPSTDADPTSVTQATNTDYGTTPVDIGATSFSTACDNDNYTVTIANGFTTVALKTNQTWNLTGDVTIANGTIDLEGKNLKITGEGKLTVTFDSPAELGAALVSTNTTAANVCIDGTTVKFVGSGEREGGSWAVDAMNIAQFVVTNNATLNVEKSGSGEVGTLWHTSQSSASADADKVADNNNVLFVQNSKINFTNKDPASAGVQNCAIIATGSTINSSLNGGSLSAYISLTDSTISGDIIGLYAADLNGESSITADTIGIYTGTATAGYAGFTTGTVDMETGSSMTAKVKFVDALTVNAEGNATGGSDKTATINGGTISGVLDSYDATSTAKDYTLNGVATTNVTMADGVTVEVTGDNAGDVVAVVKPVEGVVDTNAIGKQFENGATVVEVNEGEIQAPISLDTAGEKLVISGTTEFGETAGITLASNTIAEFDTNSSNPVTVTISGPNSASAKLTDATGNFTITGGSVIINGQIESGSIEVDGAATISGIVDAGATVTLKAGATLAGNLTVKGTLVLGGELKESDTSSMQYTVTIEGTVESADSTAKTVTAKQVDIISGAIYNGINFGTNTTVVIDGNNQILYLYGDIDKDLSAVNVRLMKSLTIPEGLTLTVDGVLDLNGQNLIVEGTLEVGSNGSIVDTATGGTISLARDGVLDNSGIIGNGSEVTISAFDDDDKYGGTGSVSVMNVKGLTLEMIRNGTTTKSTATVNNYTLAVSGSLTRVGTANSIDFDGVLFNKDMSIGDRVVATTSGNDSIVQNGVTLTIRGSMTTNGALVMANGSTVIVNGTVNGAIEAQTGEYVTSEKYSSLTTGNTSSVTLTDLKGITLTVGSVSYNEMKDGETESKNYTDQRLYISGTTSRITGGSAFTVESSGNPVYVAADATLTISAETELKSGNYIAEGTIRIAPSGTLNDAVQYTGAKYEMTNEEDLITTYITSFDAAIAIIDTVDDKTITLGGEIEIGSDLTIAADQIVNVDKAVITIDKAATVTVEENGTVNGAVNKVNGKYVIMDGASANRPLIYEVYSKTDAMEIYAGLAAALEDAQPGETITITNNSTVEGSLTIPADVTLVVDDCTLTVEKNVTVNGTLNLDNGTLEIEDAEGKLSVAGVADFTEGTITIPSSITSTGTTIFPSADVSAYDVNGAVYINDDNYAVLTTFAKAVAEVGESDSVQKTVTLYGKFSESGDVTVTDMTITVVPKAEVTLGNVTLDDSTLDVNGTLTGVVIGSSGEEGSTVDSSVSLSKVSGMNVKNGSDVNSSNVTVWSTIMTFDNGIVGGVDITAGTIGITGTTSITNTAGTENSLSVASGATLAIPGNTSLTVGSNTDEKSYVTIDGTIQVAGTLVINGIMDVNGTLTVGMTAASDVATVSVNGTMNVAGEAIVSETEDREGTLTVNGTVSVAAEGTVAGPIDFDGTGFLKAYPGSTVDDTKMQMNDSGVSQIKSTVFYINNNLYMTVYSVSVQINDAFLTAEKFDLPGFVTEVKDGYSINDITDWYTDADLTDEASAFAIGVNEAIYFKANAAMVDVSISVGEGISLYIDGIRYTTGTQLAVGTHTVSATVNPGFKGDVTIQFCGQTVTGSFTITPEMASNAYEGVISVSASGNITQDSTIVVDGGSSGDSGMGLTDYLLIILVILIVVMAIMVAMRLMRS